MDEADLRILAALQRDARLSVAELAEHVSLSPSACHRRVKLLEQSGAIAGYGARIDRDAVGLSLDVFVEITLREQTEAAMLGFEAAVRLCEDILECHLTTGDADYALRVAARDMEDFERIHRTRLARLPGVSRMRTSFALRAVKSWSGLPVRRR
ncbi:MAG: Lrp/AsnC family transcriptional regulator [Rubrimonas sp.]|uniref:Lrp/AsnC family transcriptional regulator n=1 Tax=Rubrimonas sp. TaxID=2036015 RepID=UPI002FDDF6B3